MTKQHRWTREQIAESILPVMASDWDQTEAPSPYRIADAVFSLFPQFVLSAEQIETLRQLACEGHGACRSPLHVHGCYADDGTACDEPGEHLALIQNGAER